MPLGLHPGSRRLQGRIVAQLPAIVQVLMPQSQGVHTLPEQVLQTVLAPTGLTPCIPQVLRYRVRQTQVPAHLREQRNTPVTGDCGVARMNIESIRNLAVLFVQYPG